MSETKPNSNKNRKGKKKKKKSVKSWYEHNTGETAQHWQKRETQPHLKGLHLVGVVSGKLNQTHPVCRY